MKRIVCELCDGNQFIKENGVFVCQGCGTSYSLEEAKGLMREVDGDVGSAPTVSVQNVQQPVPQVNSNQQQLENILMLAANAHSASNNSETEQYCNRAIELDATCYKAWLLKGKAIGWSSTLANNRLEEASHSFLQAISFAPDDEKESVREEAKIELQHLGLACVSVRKGRFIKYPDSDELNGFISDLKPLVKALTIIGNKDEHPLVGQVNDLLASLADIYEEGNTRMQFTSMTMKGTAAGIPQSFFAQIALMMNEAGVNAFNNIRNKYDNNDHPLQRDLEKVLSETLNCVILLECAIDACDEDDEADIARYNNLINIVEYTINLTAYENYTSYRRDICLTDESKSSRRKWIDEYNAKIGEIKEKERLAKEKEAKAEEEAKKARIEAYWEAHAEEKSALDAELYELESKREIYRKEVLDTNNQIQINSRVTTRLPSEEESDRIKYQIGVLNERRNNLGVMAGKEKRQIGEEIASLEGRLASLQNRILQEQRERAIEINNKNTPLMNKRNELNNELLKISQRIDQINKVFQEDPDNN